MTNKKCFQSLPDSISRINAATSLINEVFTSIQKVSQPVDLFSTNLEDKLFKSLSYFLEHSSTIRLQKLLNSLEIEHLSQEIQSCDTYYLHDFIDDIIDIPSNLLCELSSYTSQITTDSSPEEIPFPSSLLDNFSEKLQSLYKSNKAAFITNLVTIISIIVVACAEYVAHQDAQQAHLDALQAHQDFIDSQNRSKANTKCEKTASDNNP
ncbi:hypothetical protein [Veillonella sp. 3960]|uniref:hypothetical protein n=1 Tax=Veillonella sp. 3960 TaxID=2490955 RepID=UPI000F8D7908|nr:hypothetical protein [Veillonella sp. 3960]